MDAKAALIWLPFDDPALEASYRLDHARRSALPIRAIAVVLAAISILAGAGMFTRDAAESVGFIFPTLQREPVFWLLAGLSTVAIVVLFVLVDHPRVLPYQQRFVAILLTVLLLFDVPTTARFPLAYGLTACVLQIMTAYLLVRLRLSYAAAVGLATSLFYLGWSAATHGAPDSSTVSAFRVNAAVLGAANLILAVGCHQIERLDRLAFLTKTRVTQQAADLADALRELESAQAQLLESERHASIGRLAAGVLHEINTPIGVVASTSNALLKAFDRLTAQAKRAASEASEGGRAGFAGPGPAHPQAKRAASEASEGGRAGFAGPGPASIAAAARQLLDAQSEAAARLSEVLKGLERFVDLDRDGPRTVDVRDSLHDALSLVAGRMKGVKVQVALPDAPMSLTGDPGRVNSAFYAVLDNAASALDGHGTLSVLGRRAEATWQVDIVDDGPGVPPELRPTLFEPSLARDGPRVKMRLGLPTAALVMEAVGGRLMLVDDPGAGARFRFEWPVQDERPDAP